MRQTRSVWKGTTQVLRRWSLGTFPAPTPQSPEEIRLWWAITSATFSRHHQAVAPDPRFDIEQKKYFFNILFKSVQLISRMFLSLCTFTPMHTPLNSSLPEMPTYKKNIYYGLPVESNAKRLCERLRVPKPSWQISASPSRNGRAANLLIRSKPLRFQIKFPRTNELWNWNLQVKSFHTRLSKQFSPTTVEKRPLNWSQDALCHALSYLTY